MLFLGCCGRAIVSLWFYSVMVRFRCFRIESVRRGSGSSVVNLVDFNGVIVVYCMIYCVMTVVWRCY